MTATLGALLCLIFAAAPAAAQNADAEARFRAGDALMKEGQLVDACEAFESSNRIEPRAGTLIRIGECRELNGQLATAWSAFTDAVTRAKDERKRTLAADRAAALEPRLSYLTVSVADDTRIANLKILRNGVELDPGLWNRATPVDGGEYVITGQAPGYEKWSATVTVPAEHGRVSLDLPRFKPLVEFVDDGEQRDDDASATPVATSLFTPRRKVALGVVGAGAAALILGGVLGVQSGGLRDEAHTMCPEDPCVRSAEANVLIDRAAGRALGANIAYGVGVAAVVGAAVLWFLGGPEAEAPGHASLVIRPDLRGLDITARF